MSDTYVKHAAQADALLVGKLVTTVLLWVVFLPAVVPIAMAAGAMHGIYYLFAEFCLPHHKAVWDATVKESPHA